MAVKADITIDIDKQVGNLQNLTNIYNARVGDNKTPLTVLWRKNGMALNLKGLHAFIAGKVGDGSYNSETDKIDFPVGTPVVKYEDDGSGTLDNGQSGLTTLLIPKQMWSKTGLFAGYIGLKDENGSVFTSKDIFFKVLGNVLDAGVAINYFIGDFDKALAKAEKELEDKSAYFDQTTTQALRDLHDKYLAKAQKAEDTLGDTQASIDANLASLKLLATHIGSLEAQLKASDVVSVSDFKAKTDYLDNSINNRLKQIDTNVEAFSDLSALSAKYPNGQPGLFYAAGHLYIYNNGWVDQGAYPSAPLTENEKEILNNAIFTKAFLYDDSQIVTPYNDADLFPTNTVITFATNMTKVLHAPVQDSGTFITIGSSENGTFHDKPKDGTFQEFISYSGYTKRRMLWGGKWTKWLDASDDNEAFEFIYDDSQIVTPYNDVDLFPTNTVITFATNMTKVLHAPVQDSGTFITIGNSTDGTAHGTPKDGTFQEFISSSGSTKRRMLWGGKWTKWLGASDDNEAFEFIYDDSQIVTPYNDVDLFPTNTVITFATNMTKVLNVPTQESGTFITIGSSADGTAHGTPKDGTFQEYISSSGSTKRRMLWGGKWTEWLGADGNETPELSPSDKEFKLAKVSLSMFGKFGVIGDSYASGTLEDFNHFSQDTYADTPAEMKNNLCWGEMLARKWGTSMLHLAKGGLSTRSWLTDDQGLTKLNSSDPQDIYYLVLGINDYYGLGENYLGQESDIENKADTFYGNYGKIINAIKQKAPLAKIIMFGIAGTTDLQNKFSNAQEKIAEHFHIPFISENEDPLFSSDYYTSNMGSGHPSSYLYGAMANAFERLIQLAVYRYRPYFYNYGWNGKIADPTNIKIPDYNSNQE